MERLRNIKIVDIPESATNGQLAAKFYSETTMTLSLVYSAVYLSQGEAVIPLVLSLLAFVGSVQYDLRITHHMDQKKTQ